MGTEVWCRAACVPRRVSAYGATKVRITQARRVRSLCGTEINSRHCSSPPPPHRHLPPLCQFVTAHPSVAVPSFNTEQRSVTRERTSGRKGEEETITAQTKTAALGEEGGQVREVSWSLSGGLHEGASRGAEPQTCSGLHVWTRTSVTFPLFAGV